MKNVKSAFLCMGLISLPLLARDNAWQFEGSVGVEYGRDDNVVVEEIDLTSSLGDNFVRLRAKGGANYRATKGASFSASLAVNDMQYNTADQFDLLTVLATAGYKYKVDKTTYGFDVRHADAELAGEGFLNLTYYSSYFSTFVSKKHFVRGAYTFLDKTLDTNPDRDTNSHELGADYYFFQNGLTRYFILAGKVRTEDAVSDEFDAKSYQIRLAFKQRYQIFSEKNQLTLDINYRDKDFDEAVNRDIGDFRRDKRTRYRIENTWSPNDEIDVAAVFEHVKNSSNLTSFDFDENIFSIALNYSF